MNRRCPDNELVGLGILLGQEWIINKRRVANVVVSKKDLVYGLVYKISPSDERKLDESEGVPRSYTKHIMKIVLQSENGEAKSMEQALVYIDKERTEEGKPREEYIIRINKGVDDASARGMPKWYIDEYIRKFIPADELKEAVPVGA